MGMSTYSLMLMARVLATLELLSVACQACLISSANKNPLPAATPPPAAAQSAFFRLGLTACIVLALLANGLATD